VFCKCRRFMSARRACWAGADLSRGVACGRHRSRLGTAHDAKAAPDVETSLVDGLHITGVL
jgi:hypothetical protein